MPSASTASPNAFLAIFVGGLACGVFDITQACVGYGIQNHLPPMRIFQSVASGLLGPKAFQGGAKTAALGLFLHFLIAFIWAVIYYVASRQVTFLTQKPVIAGLLYGEFVWVMMTWVVLPLSAIHRWPPRFDPASVITGPHWPYCSGWLADCLGHKPLGSPEITNSHHGTGYLTLILQALIPSPFTL